MGYQRRVHGSTAIATIAQMSRRCTTVKDVPADAFIRKCADFLKRQPKFQVPKWADLVKTGHFKELAPYDEDWFYIRAASIARSTFVQVSVLEPSVTGMVVPTAVAPAPPGTQLPQGARSPGSGGEPPRWWQDPHQKRTLRA